MIKRFQVQNYKALRDVTLNLTPIHVLIGPNDSGKTSILEAIAVLCRSADQPLAQAFTGAWDGCDLVWRNTPDLPISFSVGVEEGQLGYDYHLSCIFPQKGRGVRVHEEKFDDAEKPLIDLRNMTTIPKTPDTETKAYHIISARAESLSGRTIHRRVYDLLNGIHFYRWDPRLLALPVTPGLRPPFRMDASGFGLSVCLDDMLGYDRRRFTDLEDRFRQIFPHIKTIRLIRGSGYSAQADDATQIPALQQADGKGIYFEFESGQQIPASQASGGVLLVLAYLAILYLPEPYQPRVILVEEPENGIHPKRLQDVLLILRDLIKEQTKSQVILTTHSPYALDLFEPEEVSLCQMGDDGAVSVHPLSESEIVKEQIKIFTLGEIWTAEGDETLAQRVEPEGVPKS